MKRYAKKKYITGGYTPVGIIPPSIIKENKESNDTFGSQFLKAAKFVAPIAGAALTGNVLPALSRFAGSTKLASSLGPIPQGSPLLSEAFKYTDKQNDGSLMAAKGGPLPNGAMKVEGAKDQKLNSSATLIKGNPSKVDGNKYTNGIQDIYLDHNEVVKGNMVVSDSVINPASGNSFAKDVADIERQIGKASKDTSLEGRNTLKHLSNRTKSLIQQQEMITGRSDGTHFDKGGPLPKGLNVKDFQEWAIKNGATIKADGAWGPQTEALYTQYKDAYELKDHTYDYNELADLTDRMGNVKQMENKNAPNRILTESEKEQYQKMDGSVPTYNVDAAQLAKDNKERFDDTSWANALKWKQPLPISGTAIPNQVAIPNLSNHRIQPTFENDELAVTMSKLGALPDLFNVDGASETPPGIVENPIITPEEQKKKDAAARFKALGANSGDALQAASVVSQMFRAHQKPKLEKRYNVNAPITKESFDVTNPLQQSNRVFKNMVSGIDAGSVNTKRAVANSMYANRLSNDSNTIQQYDVMNQGARSNYEQKLAQRQAQNIQLSQYTDDLDQRNLGAYNNAKDVAWNSVSNFGKAINDKKSAYANLEMLKKIYSDVAKNIK